MYLTNERKQVLKKYTVGQALNSFHVIELCGELVAMDEVEKLAYLFAHEEAGVPTDEEWEALTREDKKLERLNGDA